MTSFTLSFKLSRTKLWRKYKQIYWDGWEFVSQWMADISIIYCEKERCSKI